MIKVICNTEKISYSAFHLVKAFWPNDKVEVSVCREEPMLVKVIGDGETVAEVTDKEDKIEAEKELYRQMEGITGKGLPWGVLTGVRPTKLASRMVGTVDKEEFVRQIGEERLVSREKAELSWEIAVKEKRIIESAGRGWSLYINIPICPSRCSYCSFSSGLLSDWEKRLDVYVDSVIKEIGSLEITGMPTSVYIGGGTPTVLSAEQLARLIEAVNRRFSGYREFTLEAGRADTITESKLMAALGGGVTRISINPQTMQQKTLDLVGRMHKADEVIKKFHMARKMGFDNINMDVIAGLPGETEKDMEDTLRKIEELGPDSLTVHALAIKRAAGMVCQSVKPDVVENMIGLGRKYALRMGMEPYYLYRQKSIAGNLENVGYAKPGSEGLYNILIMEEVQTIIGVGAGASTKILLDKPVPDPRRGGRHMTSILHKNNEADIGRYIALF